ncbi:MAG: STAS domain-containing protein [Planctomycetota bacterium]|nr:STAS domain-containing protein [Planctomycetota bacterium]
MTSFTQITTEQVADIQIVNFNSNRVMDPMMIEEIGGELQSLIDQHKGGTFLLDLSNVEFLSSAVLNRLIVLDKNVKADKGVLAFSNLGPAVGEVFAITKLDLLFKIFDNRSAAIEALQ